MDSFYKRGADALSVRIQEALMHLPRIPFPSINTSGISKYASFNTTGWVRPGVYPQEDNFSTWIGAKPRGDYNPKTIEDVYLVNQWKGLDFKRHTTP